MKGGFYFYFSPKSFTSKRSTKMQRVGRMYFRTVLKISAVSSGTKSASLQGHSLI